MGNKKFCNFFLNSKKCLFCFTPEVMLATFLTEIVLAIYVFSKNKMTKTIGLLVVLLFLLSFFQLSEYQVCGSAVFSLLWSRLGFVAITLIPILGLEIISKITGRRKFIKTGWLLAVIFSLFFIFSPDSLSNAVCKGNYILFETSFDVVSAFYLLYYFSFLFVGVFEMARELFFIIKEKRDIIKKEILLWLIVGYFTFIIPTEIIYTLSQAGLEIIPSVMCGFAIIMALIIVFRVLPLVKKLGI